MSTRYYEAKQGGRDPAAAMKKRGRNGGGKNRQGRRGANEACISPDRRSPDRRSPERRRGNRAAPKGPLPDLTQRLIDCGAYEEYQTWREGYRRWREGSADGACGEGGQVMSMTTEGPLLSKSWRDAYRSWRQGGLRGARGEIAGQVAQGQPSAATVAEGHVQSVPPVVYDVVATSEGEPALVPSDGPVTAPMSVEDFPGEAILTIRVFRFFEDKADGGQSWEKGLQNVNSGSILWLPWHLEPNMHSKAGAKYGDWFAVHYVQVYAKHFKSQYHMCNEGSSTGAKTFGSSASSTRAVNGEAKPEGYFWYVSPAAGQEHLSSDGWRHLSRAGPFDGGIFLKRWHEAGSPLGVTAVQEVLAKMREAAEKTIIT